MLCTLMRSDEKWGGGRKWSSHGSVILGCMLPLVELNKIASYIILLYINLDFHGILVHTKINVK